jgi:hypothetical protein
MALTDSERAFIAANSDAGMVTAGPDGFPKAVRVTVGFVGDRLLSSSTAERVRTRRLREDPRCTLFVFAPQFTWLTLETKVTMVEGPEAIDLSIALFRSLQQAPTGPISWFTGPTEEADLRQILVDQGRLLYDFEVTKAYGMTGA